MADALRPILHRHALEMLPIVVRIAGVLYGVLAVAHYLLLPEPMQLWMSGLALTAALFAGFVYLSLAQPFVEDFAKAIIYTVLVLAAANVAAHLYFTLDPRQTTNYIFFMAACGFLLPGTVAFISLTIIGIASWLLIVVFAMGWDADATHYLFELCMGVLFGYFLHLLRRNHLTQVIEMERTVEILDRSRDRVRSGESLLQRLIDNIPAGVLVRDTETKVLYANRMARETLRPDGEELVGHLGNDASVQLFDLEGNPLTDAESPVSQVLASGKAQQNRVLGMRFAGGPLTWGLVNAIPLPVEGNDEPVVVIAFVDITDQRESERQLRASEQRARAILESVAEAVIQVDEEERITLFNPAARTLTGFSESEALGHNLNEVLLYSDDSNEPPGGEALLYRSGSVTRKDGSLTDVELLSAEIQTGETTGRVLTIRDVSQQLRVEQERVLIDKMNSVGQLAAGIAHDFNNLLTAVYGNITLASGNLEDKELAGSYLEKSSESILFATHLTKQLLTFASGSDPVRDVINLEKLVREATQFALSGSAVALEYDIAPDLMQAEVDAGQVQQAISNIVLNAREAMNDGGLIRIAISNVVADGDSGGGSFVNVTISDQGPGMEPELASRIFDPYFTTKDEGTGLGLATTHSIIVKHGGSITVESTPGSGSSISILLPAAQVEPVVAVPEVEASATPEHLRVLVMDDEEVVRNTIIRLLEFIGHEAIPTAEGQEAIDEYARQMQAGPTYDLVIVDLTVSGGLGGMDAASGILAIDPDARIVVSSGYSAGAEMARYKELGFCGRLEKPFRSGDLKALLAEIFPQSDL